MEKLSTERSTKEVDLLSDSGVNYRYSSAFKQKVISEIESGELTIAEARKIYDIKSSPTIYIWLRKYGKNHLINKVVQVQDEGRKRQNQRARAPETGVRVGFGAVSFKESLLRSAY